MTTEQTAAHADEQTPETTYSGLCATYSPEDNKLRLYSLRRLPTDLYERVKAAGFKWAPKQELFVSPMWTPGREDLLLELCGEIDDEDTSLVDRAAERADRFEGYSENRTREANAARAAVEAIAGNIPLGQPILVGHHSERHARKHAEKIESGMRRAVNKWETASYWERRAAGALHHAKHKESPDVRARRIKGIEADKRKQETYRDEALKALSFWSREDITLEQAIHFAGSTSSRLSLARKEGDRPDFDQRPDAYTALTNAYPNLYAPRTLSEVVDAAKRAYPASVTRYDRWINHYNNRIAFERAMLAEQGGLVADRFDLVPGGRVLVRGEWVTILRVNKKGGKVVSVSTNARFVSVRQVEEIKDYTPPEAETAAAVATAAKLPPLANYPGPDFLEMTKAEWKATHTDYKGSRELGAGAVRAGGSRPDVKCDKAENVGRHRVRTVVRGGRLQPVFLTDEKRKDPPALEPAPAAAPAAIPAPMRDDATPRTVYTVPAPNEFDAMRSQLAQGVQVVAAPQLFPTPPALAALMVDMAHLTEGMSILEPSAGTGAILAAIREAIGDKASRTAVEINSALCDQLRRTEPGVQIHNADFMDCGDELGKFDFIFMNPPYRDAQDIEHIRHARKFLKPRGTLYAICANGPRQNAVLRPLTEENGDMWEPLPGGSFRQSGTNVATVLMTLTNR